MHVILCTCVWDDDYMYPKMDMLIMYTSNLQQSGKMLFGIV